MSELDRQWYVEIAEYLSQGCFRFFLTGNDAERYIAATDTGRRMLAGRLLNTDYRNVQITESFGEWRMPCQIP